MRWILASVGSPKLAYAKAGIADYTTRIRRFTRLEFAEVKPAPRPEIESAGLLARTENSWRIAVDGTGRALSSPQWAQRLRELEVAGTDTVSLLIGGADGHSDLLRVTANECISLGPLTLQHELAQVVLLEQLYRAYTIVRGLPYHRD